MVSSLGELLDSGSFWLGIAWRAGKTVCLNAQVILVHVHVEEALIAPVSAPGVATDPVLLAVVGLAVAYNGDGMVQLGHTDVLLVDVSAIVLVKGFRGLDAAVNGSVLQLGLHLVGTNDVPVLRHVVTCVIDSIAVLNARFSLGWRWACTVTADVDGATEASSFVLSYVVHAGRVDQAI